MLEGAVIVIDLKIDYCYRGSASYVVNKGSRQDVSVYQNLTLKTRGLDTTSRLLLQKLGGGAIPM